MTNDILLGLIKKNLNLTSLLRNNFLVNLLEVNCVVV